jgi:ribulose 1,5-bisphosphate synthetase/thiazole synthase
VQEPARACRVAEVDVLVVGGGRPALPLRRAARQARTLLIERYGFLGGMGTAGGVTTSRALRQARRRDRAAGARCGR